MLNQVVLVGRITSINELDNKVVLAVTRNEKNSNGIYDTDFVPIKLPKNIFVNVCEYCKKGDLIGAKGFIESNENQEIILVVDKVTFLSSK